MKKFIMAITLMAICCLTSGAFAEQNIGCVDMTKILGAYSKAQEISSNVKAQQNDIQKMITEARNQVKAAKTDKEREDLGKKLTEQIQQKNNAFQNDYEKQVQILQNKIVSGVKKVAEDKKMDFVFKKDNLMVGGQDITDDVISELNK